MLIRVQGRHDGVKEYLEHGRKKDRELSRDELDERVVLAGDLDLTDAIVQSIDASSDRYLSVTLSFKEDSVDVDMLRKITREFEAFVFTAYRRDEYAFYAEAHLPRVKSYIDSKTGTPVERKPHIHVVLPKLNLISGQHLEPLGYVKSNIDFIDAFQEHINAKYGLASPKENRRVQLTDASEMISRYKGDLFGQANRELKEQLLDAVLDRGIERYEDFLKLLQEHGAVRIRNAGREDAYPNVKAAGADKGTNLKEHVFSREFIELPTDEKRLQLAAEFVPQYEAVGRPRETSTELVDKLQQWFEYRALEVKYLNNGPALERHRQLSPADQLSALAELERGFYAQHRKDQNEPGIHQEAQQVPQDGGQGAADDASGTGQPGIVRLPRSERVLRRPGRLYPFKRAGGGTGSHGRGADAGGPRGGRRAVGRTLQWRRLDRPWDRQSSAAANRTLAQAGSLNNLRNLSGIAVVRVSGPGSLLLPHHAPGGLEHGRTQRADELRRPFDREPGVRSSGRAADTQLEQLTRDAREGIDGRDAVRAEFALIRQQLDAQRLLAELSHSHGVMPQKYRILKAADGSDRIQAGTRKLNVSDFLTKELNLPWRDAARILLAAHTRQIGGAAPLQVYESPRAAFWRQYVVVRETGAAARRQAWADQRGSEQDRKAVIRQTFVSARLAIAKDPELSRTDRRAALSVARMARAQDEMRLAAAIAAERAELSARPGAPTFEAFLRDVAQQGDERALQELRRARREPPAPAADGENRVRPATHDVEPNAILFAGPAFTWDVSPNGDVVYRREDVDVLRDEGDAVQVLQFDRDAIEAGLRLAQGRFGRTLDLAGGEAFRQEAAKVAAEAGIYVEFSDAGLNDIMNARRAELVASRLASLDLMRGHDMPAATPPAPNQQSGPDAPAADLPSDPAL
nr:LPD7 domain-containing protein [uncultured Ralstonia sp.]